MSESLAEDGSNSCSFAGDFGAAYHALLAQDMEIKLVPVHASPATQAKSGPTPTRAPLSVVSGAEVDGRKAGGADGMAATGWRHDGHVAMRRPDGITTESLDSEFEEALVRLERVSQRLVVEQQYGQRLEALTGSLVGKIQVRLSIKCCLVSNIVDKCCLLPMQTDTTEAKLANLAVLGCAIAQGGGESRSATRNASFAAAWSGRLACCSGQRSCECGRRRARRVPDRCCLSPCQDRACVVGCRVKTVKVAVH